MSYQRAFERLLRVGVVGVGDHSYRNLLPALHYLPVQLVALCDLDSSLLERTGAEYRVDDLYTDAESMYVEQMLDAVLICAGPRHHPALAASALAAGLHVWLEKPPALNVAGVDAIIAARGDRVCAVGFKKAYMPATRKARELLTDPAFGTLRSILAVYPVTIPRNGAAVLASDVVSEWLSVGCHPLSLMIALGDRVESVTTLRGPGEEAVGIVFLQFANGACGVFHLAGGSPALHAGERYDLYGDGRIISIENSTKVSYHRGVPFDYRTQVDFTAPDTGTDFGSVVWEASHRQSTLENKAIFIQGIVQELMDFCGAVLEARQPAIGTLEFARHVMQVYQAGLLSNGQPVTID